MRVILCAWVFLGSYSFVPVHLIPVTLTNLSGISLTHVEPMCKPKSSVWFKEVQADKQPQVGCFHYADIA